MSIPRLVSIVLVLALFGGCTPIRLYTESVKAAFDPKTEERIRQQTTTHEKERLCGRSAC
jgi:hypothetical protein